MKTNKDDKQNKRSDGNIETPPPPQVIDPSVPPEDQRNEKRRQPDEKRTAGRDKKNPKKVEDTSGQKLAPREEL